MDQKRGIYLDIAKLSENLTSTLEFNHIAKLVNLQPATVRRIINLSKKMMADQNKVVIFDVSINKLNIIKGYLERKAREVKSVIDMAETISKHADIINKTRKAKQQAEIRSKYNRICQLTGKSNNDLILDDVVVFCTNVSADISDETINEQIEILNKALVSIAMTHIQEPKLYVRVESGQYFISNTKDFTMKLKIEVTNSPFKEGEIFEVEKIQFTGKVIV